MEKSLLKSDIESDVRKRADEILHRRGMTMASFLRTKVYDLVEQYDVIEAGKTQIDPRICRDVA